MAKPGIASKIADKTGEMADRAGRGFFGGLWHGLTGGLGGALKEGFGGLFSGGLIFGPILFILQATGAAGPIAEAIGGDDLADKVRDLGNNGGADNIGKRMLISAAGGAALGAAFGGGKGLINGVADGVAPKSDGKPHTLGGGVMIAGIAILATSVMMGAVKNGNLKLADNKGDAPQSGALPAPAKPAPTPVKA